VCPIKYNVKNASPSDKLSVKVDFELNNIKAISGYFHKIIQREKEISNLKLPSLKLLIPLVELSDLFIIAKDKDKIQLNNLSSDKFKCKVCFKLGANDVFFEKDLMRQHIGQHMVLCHIPPHENLCGFCGEVCGSNNEISRKYGNVISSCDNFHPYSFGAAIKSSARSPCTNRLISCSTCKVIIWTYNVSTHFHNRHPEMDKSIFASFTPPRTEILAVHNWGIKKTTISNKESAKSKKQAPTRKDK
jgi:hypothetical protein